MAAARLSANQPRLPIGDDQEIPMIDQNTSIVPNPNSFLGRVSQHDAARKGAAAFVAGVLVAVVSEALWPQER